jgi:hypothetical protein
MAGRGLWNLAGAAESQFQLHYFGHTFWMDLGTCVFLQLASLINLVKVKVLAKSTTHTNSFWLSWVLPSIVLVHIILLGQVRYIKYRGVLSIGSRMLFSFGLAFNSCPTCSSWCMVLWRHRLVLISWGHVLGAMNAYFYWIGAGIAWLAADLCDAADPAGLCGHSLQCVADAVRDVVAHAAVTARSNPGDLASQILASISSRRSLNHLADVILPGMVLTYLEYKARKAWVAQQQQLLSQSQPAASFLMPHPRQQRPRQPGPATAHIASSSSLRAGQQKAGSDEPAVAHVDPPQPLQQQQTAAGTTAVAAGAAPPPPTARPAAPGAMGPSGLAAVPAAVAARLRQAVLQKLAQGRPLYQSPVESSVLSFKLQPPADASETRGR